MIRVFSLGVFAVLLAVPTSAQDFPPGTVYSTVSYASGTITTGGIAQNVAWNLSAPKMRCIQNPKSASEDLFVSFGPTAASTASQDLPAGAQVCWPWKGPVSVYAATTSHAFIAVEAQ